MDVPLQRSPALYSGQFTNLNFHLLDAITAGIIVFERND